MLFLEYIIHSYLFFINCLHIQQFMKESVNSNGHKFHQYQQNGQLPLISTKLTENKMTTTYDVGTGTKMWQG